MDTITLKATDTPIKNTDGAKRIFFDRMSLKYPLSIPAHAIEIIITTKKGRLITQRSISCEFMNPRNPLLGVINMTIEIDDAELSCRLNENEGTLHYQFHNKYFYKGWNEDMSGILEKEFIGEDDYEVINFARNNTDYSKYEVRDEDDVLIDSDKLADDEIDAIKDDMGMNEDD